MVGRAVRLALAPNESVDVGVNVLLGVALAPNEGDAVMDAVSELEELDEALEEPVSDSVSLAVALMESVELSDAGAPRESVAEGVDVPERE